MKKDGNISLTCIECLEYSTKLKNDSKCDHGRQKSRCKDCKGVGICEHERRKSECALCEGGARWEHKNVRSICVQCKGGGP